MTPTLVSGLALGQALAAMSGLPVPGRGTYTGHAGETLRVSQAQYLSFFRNRRTDRLGTNTCNHESSLCQVLKNHTDTFLILTNVLQGRYNYPQFRYEET